MRDIRTRIAQQHGVSLTDRQVEELAARRLESILDVRTISPTLVEQLRQSSASERTTTLRPKPVVPPYQFEDTTLYESSRGFMRMMRRLLNPILKLFFNPNPLIQALHAQARLNTETAQRESEQAQRQAEWNALHYELLQRMITEISQLSLEAQSLVLRVESLSTKVDFNERRVRGIEGMLHEAGSPNAAAAVAAPRGVDESVVSEPATTDGITGEAARRRRRRRRSRRGPGGPEGAPPPAVQKSSRSEGEGVERPSVPAVETDMTDRPQPEAAAPQAPAPVAAQSEHDRPATEPPALLPPASLPEPGEREQ